MEKCSNHVPDFKEVEFAENPKRKGIYDMQQNKNQFTKFWYFRLQTPKQSYLMQQGAKYVCESWEQGKKILHTGLIPTGIENYYFGDHREQINGVQRSSVIIFHFVPSTSVIRLYYFNHYNKKSLVMKNNFCKEFIKTKINNE